MKKASKGTPIMVTIQIKVAAKGHFVGDLHITKDALRAVQAKTSSTWFIDKYAVQVMGRLLQEKISTVNNKIRRISH